MSRAVFRLTVLGPSGVQAVDARKKNAGKRSGNDAPTDG
jgi:hypothetical protein